MTIKQCPVCEGWEGPYGNCPFPDGNKPATWERDPWAHWYDAGGGYDMELIPSRVIAGLGDAYDDGRIDALIHAFLHARKKVQDLAIALSPVMIEADLFLANPETGEIRSRKDVQ